MSPKTPILSAEPRDASIISGTRVTLTCLTLSSGSVTYSFFKGNSQVADNKIGIYSFNSVVITDSGAYTCSASIDNKVSSKSTSYTLTVVGV